MAGYTQLQDSLFAVFASLLRAPLHHEDAKLSSSSGGRLDFAAPQVSPLRLRESKSALREVAVLPDMSGVWIKDKRASDCMEPVLRLMHMGGIVRQAIKLVKGMNIKQGEDTVTIEVFSVIGWFKMVEKYSMAGEPGFFKRRDLRRGRHEGSIRVLPPLSPLPRQIQLAPQSSNEQQQQQAEQEQAEQQPQARLALDLLWGDPHGGTGTDVYQLLEPNLLHVYSTLKVAGQEVCCLSVFHRKKGSRPH